MTNQFNHGYALLIGVGSCTNYDKWSLPVTVKDAHALKAILTDPALCAYPDDEEHLRLLHNETATKTQILDGLNWLQQRAAADPHATIIIYFSGHGWLSDNGDYYLIDSAVIPFDLPGSALKAETFIDSLRTIPAERLLAIIDCCHAQGMATAKKTQTPDPATDPPPGFTKSTPPKELTHRLKEGQGRAVFLSSRGAQKSYIRPDQSLSIFTSHLIEALRGAGNQPGDTDVRISNLMNYLGKRVPATVKELFAQEQTPFFDYAAEDFSIALLHAGKGFSKELGWDSIQPSPSRQTTTYTATNTGSGAIAQGPGATAAGARGIAIGGNATGNTIITGDNNRTTTTNND